MGANIIGPVRTGLTPQGRDEDNRHRCGRCYGPYGRSAIPCPNNPNALATYQNGADQP